MWSDHHRRLNSTQFIIDWIPFLLPNQQQQSIEGNSNTSKCAKADFTWTKYGTDSQKEKKTFIDASDRTSFTVKFHAFYIPFSRLF